MSRQGGKEQQLRYVQGIAGLVQIDLGQQFRLT
jgi:hypothetical protein